MSAISRFVRRLPRLSPRQFRYIAGGAALASIVVLLASARWEFELGYVTASQHTWSTALRRGQLELWRDNAHFDEDVFVEGALADRASGVHFRVGPPSYYEQVSTAWRPYHARVMVYSRFNSFAHGVVIPLWPLVLASLVLTGYAHGVVVGERRATIGRCRRCGYDIRGVRPGVPCPECGTRTPSDVPAIEVHVNATEAGATTPAAP